MHLKIRLRALAACAAVWLAVDPAELWAQLASLEKAVSAGRDVWGEAAMELPNGPSYEFFRDLLPPPRYVNADYRYYPIVLSSPKGLTKASLVSNGSGINLRGGARSWRDNGTPITFRVGVDEFLFGGLKDRVSEPTLADGYLPIVEINYQHTSPVQSEGAVPLVQERVERAAEIYRLEAFADTDPGLANNCVVMTRFSLSQGAKGRVTVQLDAQSSLTFKEGVVTDISGQVVAVFDANWEWERNRALANLTEKVGASAAFPTKALDPAFDIGFKELTFDQRRASCARTWRDLLKRCMFVETPEPLVNDAWKNLLIQNFTIMQGDRIHYSALNQYDALYQSEGSDAALAMLTWGCEEDFRKILEPLLDHQRKGLEYQNAATKLIDICRYYWQTRDAKGVAVLRDRWEREATLLVENRNGENGLFPKQRYCGDISTMVQSVNVNANAWRAMRDLSALLGALGEIEPSQHYAKVAAEFRANLLSVIGKSVRREISPPFVPVALLDQEPAHNPITHVRIGSYWNIIIGYTIASGIFPPGSEEEDWIPHYQEQHGGLCMGMTRSGGAQFNFWSGEHRVNPLYGTRYALDVLRRDEPDRALVSFYGMLAQGMARNTFVGGEGSTLQPVDELGRFFYCPPNSAANGHVLTMLRNQLVQDLDRNDDGRPETLRLLFATSRRWLENGNSIRIENAPTAFGKVSVRAHSELEVGRVVIELELPARNPIDQILLRARVPDGWQTVSASCASEQLAVDARGTVDISKFAGKQKVVFAVNRSDLTKD